MFKKIKNHLEGCYAREWEQVDKKKYLTDFQLKQIERGKKSLNDYLPKIKAKFDKENYYFKKIEQIKNIEQTTKTIKSMTITVNWVKSNIWGNCPTSEIKVYYNDNSAVTYNGSRAGGCGYDKESTTIANALNQIHELRRELLAIQENNFDANSEKLFSYGVSTFEKVPYFSGGVGFNCFIRNLEKLGFKYNHLATGKMFDVYTFER